MNNEVPLFSPMREELWAPDYSRLYPNIELIYENVPRLDYTSAGDVPEEGALNEPVPLGEKYHKRLRVMADKRKKK